MESGFRTPQVSAKVGLAKRNELGIRDRYVSPAPGVVVFVPMRVVPNSNGSEVVIMVFQTPDMSEEKFAADIGLVEMDLKTPRQVLEEN
ncbi:MAG TPA: hypothetical protein VJZ68_08330 [Nitrososphaera sp.]|nr:hypothetical protein [Nitrososphaera sp.]